MFSVDEYVGNSSLSGECGNGILDASSVIDLIQFNERILKYKINLKILFDGLWIYGKKKKYFELRRNKKSRKKYFNFFYSSSRRNMISRKKLYKNKLFALLITCIPCWSMRCLTLWQNGHVVLEKITTLLFLTTPSTKSLWIPPPTGGMLLSWDDWVVAMSKGTILLEGVLERRVTVDNKKDVT